jgi:hypothetical protein
MHKETSSLGNAQDYAQKPLRNCTNSASLLASVIHCHIGIPTKRPGIKFPITKRPVYNTSSLYNVHFKKGPGYQSPVYKNPITKLPFYRY